jgi:hypothetical protein
MERGGRDPRMWTAWCMKFMEEEGMFCIYPNLPQVKVL